MTLPSHPRLRAVEAVEVGSPREPLLALRDPEGFAEMVVLPYGAAMLAGLMDGRRTLDEIGQAFRAQTGVPLPLSDIEQFVGRLDEAHLLAGQDFDRYRQEQLAAFRKSTVRPASHAGRAYAAEPDALCRQLDGLFTADGGPGPIDPAARPDGRPLCGLLSPHIDLHRGGTAFAWGYKRVAEDSDADLFVVLGTAHGPMAELCCALRKDFATPLGRVRTDRQFIDRMVEHLESSVAGRLVDLLADEPAHRFEHSIEFQVVFLQYLFGGRRPFGIVPLLVGSFHEFIAGGWSPDDSPELQAVLAAVRAAAGRHRGRVCYVAGADLAHIGPRFGDLERLDRRRLGRQADDDQRLLAAACRCDADAFFRHVAGQNDRNRVCGLSPTWLLLRLIGPARGELLKYAQAAEPDGSSCVTFASAAFYRPR